MAIAAAAAVAALAAAADGALLAVQRRSARPVDAVELIAERDRARRTLAFTRLLSQLAVGIFLGMIVRPGGVTAAEALLVVAGALALVLLTETAARAWGDSHAHSVDRRVGPLVHALELVLAPVTMLAAALDRGTASALPTPPVDDDDREAAAAQFREVVASEAEVTRDEAALLHGVFSLGDTEVHQVMVPRVDIVGIELEMPWSQVVDRVRSSEHSRFPVYEEELDEIVGVLYAKDLLSAILADDEPEAGWESLIRPASFVPRTKTIGDQLRDFRAERQHIAFVADEFGGIAGLVTIEDVLEEIVGEIRDEYDEEEPEIVSEEGRCFWVSGRVTLDELSEELGQDFERDGITTVGGLVYDELGRPPRPGEAFVVGGYRVVVERVVRRKIERVYFERLPEPTTEEQP
jgi:CBS domain containing-hemolysin-like protein